MRFIGYARVSDKEQLKKGFSVEAQQEAIEAWAVELGHTISRVMVEPGRSGAKPSQEARPVFEQAVRLVLAGAADGLVVKWMDRFARNVEDFLRVRSQFFQAGKQLISISEPLLNGDPGDPVARYIAVAIMNAYQLQAELSGLKAAQGRERRARQGQYPGLPPIGYTRIDKKIVIHPELGPTIATSFLEFATGRWTLDSWLKEAAGRGYKSSRGQIINKSGWHRIFRNPFYVGRYVWKGQEYLGDYEPLVSQATFEAVQEILDSYDKSQGEHHFWLLSGLLWSEPLSRLMVGAQIKGRFNYYRAAADGRPEHNVRAEEIEGRVIERLNCIRWDGDNPYRVPEEWRLALKVSSNVGQLYAYLGHAQQRELLRLIFLKKGIVVASGGSISKIDCYSGFRVDVR
ncbi:MAG: recombinase family protein [Anaerolineae bacterium]|nr:recombinase family protein [Anaerolineae bacterium]